MTIYVRCPAKVNLHLEVLGVRGDGYRELRTLFAAVGVWDELWAEPAEGGVLELTVDAPAQVPTDGSNLIVRAARALADRCHPDGGARLFLRKRIPVAGGLGGGSADAAATLALLADLWGPPITRRDLLAVAATLGADVPFFLFGGLGWGVGRGSEVYPLPDAPPWWTVLLPGREGVPTPEVYAALPPRAVDGRLESEVYHWVVSGGDLPLGACRNDLQPTVVEHWREVGVRLAALEATEPLLAMVSGSGGTVYGLYAGEVEATRAAAGLAALAPVVAPVLARSHSQLVTSVVEGPWRSPRSESA